MKELSLHLLDLIENAVAAGATRVEVEVVEDAAADRLALVVRDNGRGMPPELAARATDAFTTTRTTRPVGMGLALLAGAAEQAGGWARVTSSPGEGTAVEACFQLSHVDRAPLGRVEHTLAAAATLHPELGLVYTHRTARGAFTLRLPLPSRLGPARLAAEVARLVGQGRARIGSAA